MRSKYPTSLTVSLVFILFLMIHHAKASSIKTIRGIVVEANTNKKITNATVIIQNSSIIEDVQLSTNENGIFEVELSAGMYQIQIKHPDYYTHEVFRSISFDEEAEITLSISLKPVIIGQVTVLEGIEFSLNDAKFKVISREIDDLIYMLRMNPYLIVEISCHTDSRGDDKYNLKLSQKRARNLVKYLLVKSINKKQLIAKGYGETLPLNHCKNGVRCSGKEHTENRRVEYTIIGFIDDIE